MPSDPGPGWGELGPGGEDEWRRLQRQVQLASGFWLGFVFSPSPLLSQRLRSRMEQELVRKSKTLLVISVSRPDQLIALLEQLPQRDDVAAAGCTWVEGLHEDPPWPPDVDDPALRRWTRAWDTLFLRLNERRDRLRARLAGGLLLVTPPSIKPRIREAAPDLWSVRSLVIELPPLPPPSALPWDHDPPSDPTGFPDPDFALEEAHGRGALASNGEAYLRAAEGLLAAGRPEDALSAARQATTLLRTAGPLLESRSLAVLAKVEHATGEVEARTHIEQAIDQRRSTAAEIPLSWFHLAARLAVLSGDTERAVALYREAIARLRGRPAAPGQLASALTGLGAALRAARDLDDARAALEEAISVAHAELANAAHRSNATDLTLALRELGHVHLDAGNLVSARACYDGALLTARTPDS